VGHEIGRMFGAVICQLWLLGAGMAWWDVIVLIGCGSGIDMEFFNLSARVPNKHSSSIFILRFSHAKIFPRWFHPSTLLNT